MADPITETMVHSDKGDETDEAFSCEVSHQSDDKVKLPTDISHLSTTSLLKGWRLHIATVAFVTWSHLLQLSKSNYLLHSLCLSIFLANLEISIVSTSLVAITNDLKQFSQSSWIILAYLLTYTCFLVIWAKFSDIFGRKLSMIFAVGVFTIFSGACGATHTTTQLIVCRAFQGLGGSGIYSLTAVIFFEIVPETRYALYTSLVSAVFALSQLLGPTVGGAINNNTTWRWVFLINVPAGITAAILLIFTLPTRKKQRSETSSDLYYSARVFSPQSLQRLDYLGTILLLSASLLLITSLQIAGLSYSWSSAAVLSTLIISVVLWPLFCWWEWFVTVRCNKPEPVFPWRFARNRVWMGMLLNSALAGFSFTVPVIEIPLRFQTVYGSSPFRAGISLIPFAFAVSFGSLWATTISSKLKLPPVHIMLIGTALQVAGFALLSRTPFTENIWKPQYGYDVLAGLGMGANAGLLVLMTPFAVEKRDQSVAMGAIIQFRMMGGSIGLAIATCVFNSYMRSKLSAILTTEQVQAILESAAAIQMLSPALKTAVKAVLAHSFTIQFRILIGTSAVQYLVILLMWQRKPLMVA